MAALKYGINSQGAKNPSVLYDLVHGGCIHSTMAEVLAETARMCVDPNIALVEYRCKLTKPSTHDVCYQLEATASVALDEGGAPLHGGRFITSELTSRNESGALLGTHKAKFFRYNTVPSQYASGFQSLANSMCLETEFEAHRYPVGEPESGKAMLTPCYIEQGEIDPAMVSTLLETEIEMDGRKIADEYTRVAMECGDPRQVSLFPPGDPSLEELTQNSELSGPFLKHIWDSVSGEILSMTESQLSGNEAMMQRGIDFRQFLDPQERKAYGVVRFSEQAVDYAFCNVIHPGPLLLVIDEATAELMKTTISPTCSTSEFTLSQYLASEIHVGETYKVETFTTQDVPDKPVIICECVIRKVDGTIVAAGEARMADVLRIPSARDQIRGLSMQTR
eukprot:TRINITY_DN12265_c0_g1_i3.p1 TRINITY_DN12265_c0_g1~~TRINITY_DN12265_c0_g1_i3.p1  ORF type:complete len:393 (+),score=101.58 TRINITY_DN12265_c0_g1_i3:369-1547(+)